MIKEEILEEQEGRKNKKSKNLGKYSRCSFTSEFSKLMVEAKNYNII